MNLQSKRPLIVSPSSSPVFIPHDLIVEVLSFLPVKSVIRLKCMSKKFHSLVSDPTFVNLHLHRSAKSQDVTLVYNNSPRNDANFTVFRLSEDPPICFTLPSDPYYQLHFKECHNIVGSCNGLLCLSYYSYGGSIENWLRFWNPATRTLSDKLRISGDVSLNNLTFGYDSSTKTYKLVHFIKHRTEVKVLNLDDNVWRNIQNSPICHYFAMHFVHMSDSVIWLAIYNYPFCTYNCKFITIEQFAVISLDLGTEKHTLLSLPQGFNEVPFVKPHLSVLKDSLCFSHDFKQTHFVIWQMKEFGVEDSWTQLFKTRYYNLQKYYPRQFQWIPLCMSEKSDTLLLSNPNTAILYNWRYNRLESIDKPWRFHTHYYTESLVSYR